MATRAGISPTEKQATRCLRIAFLHPDLGIGGAERLVVDAAVGLAGRGHQPIMYTSHHDPLHCFEETRDGTLQICVRGNRLPRSLWGRMYIVCAILRQWYLALFLLFWDQQKYDVMMVDQLSACLPLLNWFGSTRVVFYCHFPDKLLTARDSKLKQLYRIPLDALEEWTTGMADTIVVNSGFTAGVFRRSFPSITTTPRILYPPINLASYNRIVDYSDPSVQLLQSSHKILLSINRFERKKDVELALHAFAALTKDDLVNASTFATYRLIVSGGYDARVIENVDYLKTLESLATGYGLKTFTLQSGATEKPPQDAQVVFLCSFNDAQRTYLLANASLLLYTPSNEHFGITPVEAMYGSVPVIACNNGGPLESVQHTVTGLLLPPTPSAWAKGIHDLMTGVYDTTAMGKAGRQHVEEKFSLAAFTDQLEDILEQVIQKQKTASKCNVIYYGWSVVIPLFIVSICYLALFRN
ncbi:alpha-1,3/1,6-mannosyltransferase ALG2 [Spinellus fusiger]|nr:alpha-1,3/1,6-mannosyltransferase ALG2 [Spinellus fusiger]